ncbi:hypothetical protein RRG08_002090 [Elysia crispata]|uniref:Sphingomyelin phosphodiesterase n=1 Tax=Elysia crispata TaxID=231223 RepID=A0AAE0ZM66_9GAST|nr:hypothetical protein RRG08_002090 [Elysia crispata]
MSVNTILYIRENSLTVGVTDPADQFKWMGRVLEAARQNGEKVIVTGHVQPGFRTPGLRQLFQMNFLRRYIDLLTSYSDVIVASHYGHDHADGFKLLQKDGDRPERSVPVFTSLSETPRQRDSSPSYPHNPSIRLVEYGRDTGRHVNYRQFFINLKPPSDAQFFVSGKAIRRSCMTSELPMAYQTELYDFRVAYGVPDGASCLWRTRRSCMTSELPMAYQTELYDFRVAYGVPDGAV